MPITKVHKIKGKVGRSLKYIKNEDKTTFIVRERANDEDIANALSYISNADKTKNYVFVEGYRCNPATAEYEFSRTKKQYLDAHGGKDRNPSGTPNAAWHLIQSFPPEERDPQLIHQIGMELIEQVGGGRFQAVVSTHVEGTEHIHNHIIFNAYPMDPKQTKFHRSREAYEMIQEISDKLAEKYGLSIILGTDVKDGKGMSYHEWMHNKAGTSWKQLIKDAINETKKESKSWDELIDKLRAQGFEVEERGDQAKFRAPGQTRWVRDYTLGPDYIKHEILCDIDPEYKKAFERAIESAEQEQPVDEKNIYEAMRNQKDEYQRWRQASQMTEEDRYRNRINPDDPAYKIARYDKNGNRRTDLQIIIMAAIKIINASNGAYDDQIGMLKYPRNPVYASRDWKMQQLLTTYKKMQELGVDTISDIEKRKDEIGVQLARKGAEIRRCRAALEKMQPVMENLQTYKDARVIMLTINQMPEGEDKQLFIKENQDVYDSYNKAVAELMKVGSRNGQRLFYYDKTAKAALPIESNIQNTEAKYQEFKDRIDVLEDERKGVAKQYKAVLRMEYTVNLAQHKLFVYGPKYTEEHEKELRARSEQDELQRIQELKTTSSVSDDDFGDYMDELLQGAEDEYIADQYYPDDEDEEEKKRKQSKEWKAR